MTHTVQMQSQSCQTLDDWLCYIEQSHPIEKIELGLGRVSQVAARAQLAQLPGTVILVAGTNGKGTTIRTLEQLLLAQGYQVGVYSSPHLLTFNERLRINGQDVDDQRWVQGLADVELLRQDVPLTYFEFTTLAAFAVLKAQQPDFCLIEVGLGGRLDATNIVEPAVSVLTTVDLDHQDWLGPDRASIGREKAGIFRAGKPVVIADLQPPDTVLAHASALACQLCCAGQHFQWQQQDATRFSWSCGQQHYTNLPVPALPLQNVSTALAVLAQLDLLPSTEQLVTVLGRLNLPGRMQWLNRQVLLDVAHNPQSAAYLAARVQQLSRGYRQVHLLVGMLKDKDIVAALQPFSGQGWQWHLTSLPGVRGASSAQLAAALPDGEKACQVGPLSQAYPELARQLAADELLVVFGSFVTVSAVLAAQEML